MLHKSSSLNPVVRFPLRYFTDLRYSFTKVLNYFKGVHLMFNKKTVINEKELNDFLHNSD